MFYPQQIISSLSRREDVCIRRKEYDPLIFGSRGSEVPTIIIKSVEKYAQVLMQFPSGVIPTHGGKRHIYFRAPNSVDCFDCCVKAGVVREVAKATS